MEKNRLVDTLSLVATFGLLIGLSLGLLMLVSACQTPTPPTSPIATPISLLPSPEKMEVLALVPSNIITGEIVILWQDENLGIYPQEIYSSGEVTTTLYFDFELRLGNGEVLTQTVNTNLSAPDTIGTGQFNSNIPYEWQNVPPGLHRLYSRMRWEIESSDVVVVENEEYVPYRETVYGVTVTDGVLVEADVNHFAFYQTVEVRQTYRYYLPVILKGTS